LHQNCFKDEKWTKVRYLPSTESPYWFKTKDHLKGEASDYGNMVDDQEWNMKFSELSFTKYLVISDTLTDWVIFTKSSLDGWDGTTTSQLAVEAFSDPSNNKFVAIENFYGGLQLKLPSGLVIYNEKLAVYHGTRNGISVFVDSGTFTCTPAIKLINEDPIELGCTHFTASNKDSVVVQTCKQSTKTAC
jgi:hypothetical protein